MDRTPNTKSKLMCRRRKSFDSSNPIISTLEQNLTSTPTQSKQSQVYNLRNDCSPIHFQSTQEVIDDLDVVWDWNSPHSTKNRAQTQKRTYSSSSVKVPLKRHVSHNQIQTFENLKSELEALRNQLDCEIKSIPDKTSDLNSILKPLCDANTKQTNQNELDLEALFEDSSVEEELFLCSQRVEETLEFQTNISKQVIFNTKSKNNFIIPSPCTRSSEINCNKRLNFEAGNDRSRINYICKPYARDNAKKTTQRLADFGNNSFDLALEVFKDEDADLLSHANTNLQMSKGNTTSCDNVKDDCKMEPVKIQYNLEEIKRKKLQALEKLEARKKQNTSSKEHNSPEKVDNVQHNAMLNETSPIKCSPEEIEQKRLQALAKLQAKKKQDVIEKNRQDALKRLEMNKKRRAINSQRSLMSRTHSR